MDIVAAIQSTTALYVLVPRFDRYEVRLALSFCDEIAAGVIISYGVQILHIPKSCPFQ
jgi:hypothetical protein